MKPLNSLVVISWHTPWKCVRVLVGTMSIQLFDDNHDLWVTCTTSTECKTVITAVLTVLSGMDPHMICGNTEFWFGLVWLGCQSGCLLGCGSVTVRFCDVIEVRTLRRYCDLSTSIPKAKLLTTGFCVLNQVASLLLACMS
jgi:hypothetical protein